MKSGLKKSFYIAALLLLFNSTFATNNSYSHFSRSINTYSSIHSKPLILNDSDTAAVKKNINFRKAVWLGVFTGTVGGHLWYIGYKKQALKRTFDGSIAYLFIALGVLAHVWNFALLKHFGTLLLAIGLLMWLIVVIRTGREISFLTKHKLPPKEKTFKQVNENQNTKVNNTSNSQSPENQTKKQQPHDKK